LNRSGIGFWVRRVRVRKITNGGNIPGGSIVINETFVYSLSLFYYNRIFENMDTQTVTNGSLLVAEPFLGDSNFERSVILVCEHNEDGTFGLVLNQIAQVKLNDVLTDEMYHDYSLYVGGPVQQNTLHYIHRLGSQVEESVELTDGLFWSGNFDQLRQLINAGTVRENDVRFFVGYSGWSGGQLADEMAQNAWIISQADANFIFDTPSDQFWRGILRRMGGQYRVLSHYPTDPRLN
jgi:putative transcriptional regulator